MNIKTKNSPQNRPAIKKNSKAAAGEIGLILGILTDSLGVALILKADFGYSPVVSVQYALSQAFPIISIGTWSYITQAAALMALAVVLMDIKPVYGFSMILAVGFGYLIDLFNYLLSGCPAELPFRIVYFLIGFFLISLGIALFMLCKMPLLPIELMLREVTAYKKIEFRRLKTSMDVGCVVFTAVLTFVTFDMVRGLGIGTILSALLMGTLTQFIRDVIAKNFEFYVCTRFLVR